MGDLSAPASSRAKLSESYTPPSGFRDELFESSGKPRALAEGFLGAFDRLGLKEIARRLQEARRLLDEHGATYNVYGDPQGATRPWKLDIIPNLIHQSEWNGLERGLIQRTRLLNAVLDDIYHEQKSLREGFIPPELVFGNRGFLRPCHGIRSSTRCHLFIHAVDLARSSDGSWWVVGDRTQNPSGLGYALENRIVLSRTLPDIFRDCHARRLATFLRDLRSSVLALAPHRESNPTIALLTPGPANEIYFEHAFLARYLGYTLVEGPDLTVRDNKVFLKSMKQLQPIDIIIRRLDDEFCDRLELRDDSTLGVPGLVQALHAEQVSIVNALGSGLVESPGILGYLPSLCQFLLGESLMLPSVATWWCGDEQARAFVRDNLRSLVIKRALPSRESAVSGRDPIFGATLDEAAARELMSRIDADPNGFVAQEQVALSTIPVLHNQELEARHVVLRAFVVGDGRSYHVFPGGLTRVATAADSLNFSMRQGGESKDTWIIDERAEVEESVRLPSPADQAIALSRGSVILSNRVADDFFWLGRYTERTDGMVRLLRTVLLRLADKSAPGDLPELAGLVRVMREVGLLREGESLENTDFEDLEKRLIRPNFASNTRENLAGTIQSLHTVAAAVRDRISSDAWRVIQRVEQEFSAAGTAKKRLSDFLGLLDQMIITLSAFSGLEMESMTRGRGWRFLDMGRRIERALAMTLLIEELVARETDVGLSTLNVLLEIGDSAMTYRSRYRASFQIVPILDLLLLDETNPRSVAFQLVQLSAHVHAVRLESTGMPASEEKLILRLLSRVRLAEVTELAEAADGGRRALGDLTRECLEGLAELSRLISREYLAHADVSRQMISFRAESES